MSAICILTPVVIGSWPAIQAAVTGAIAALGFSVANAASQTSGPQRVTVEEPIENSEVLAEHMARGEKIVATRGNIQIEVGRDERGACTVCVSGEGVSHNELRKIGRQVSSKIVQQYTYHKVITELKTRQFAVASEQVAADGTIKLYVRRG